MKKIVVVFLFGAFLATSSQAYADLLETFFLIKVSLEKNGIEDIGLAREVANILDPFSEHNISNKNKIGKDESDIERIIDIAKKYNVPRRLMFGAIYEYEIATRTGAK